MKFGRRLLTTTLGAIALFFSIATKAQQKYVGGDISLLPSYEASNAWYVDENGQHITDMLKYLKGQGLNSMRVRLFVDPSKASEDEKRQGVRQDLEYVKKLGKRIKDAGFSLMLDFHYSDTWADPGSQWTPSAWQSLGDEQLKQKIYDYTKDCLQQMVDAGATPDFIQTGNEISYGMLWGARGTNQNRCYTNSGSANWNRFYGLLQQAGKACREVCPQARIILHSERVPKTSVLKDFFDRMKNNGVDYDIIGLSYYPYHHGGMQNLENALNIVESYDKDIMIVETGYYYAWYPSNAEYQNMVNFWPATPVGQASYTKDLIATLKNHERVIGLYWWFLEACENGTNPVVTPSGWYNASLFNDSNVKDTGWDYGKVMPAMKELKSFLGSTSGLTMVSFVSRDHFWYNLQGIRFDNRPQRRGLYITNGQKAFVK